MSVAVACCCDRCAAASSSHCADGGVVVAGCDCCNGRCALRFRLPVNGGVSVVACMTPPVMADVAVSLSTPIDVDDMVVSLRAGGLLSVSVLLPGCTCDCGDVLIAASQRMSPADRMHLSASPAGMTPGVLAVGDAADVFNSSTTWRIPSNATATESASEIEEVATVHRSSMSVQNLCRRWASAVPI